MNEDIKISVLVTCYNHAPFIAKALNSVMSQDFNSLEIIVLDDASRDSSQEVIKKATDGRTNVRLVCHQQNQGIMATFNEGLRLARGEHMAVLDGDDYWADPTKLSRQDRFLEEHPDYVLVGSGILQIDRGGGELYKTSNLCTDEEIRKFMLIENPLGHSSVLYRRQAAISAGGYAGLRVNLDYELWLKLGLKGKLANLSEYSTVHRLTGLNTMTRLKFVMYRERVGLIWAYRRRSPHCLKGLLKTCLEVLGAILPPAWKQFLVKVLGYSKIKQLLFYR